MEKIYSDSRNAVHSKWRIAPTRAPKINISLNREKDGDDDRIVGGGLHVGVDPSSGHRLRHRKRQFFLRERNMSERIQSAFNGLPVRVHHERDHAERGGFVRNFRQRHLDDYPLQTPNEEQHQLPANRISQV